MKSSDFCKTFWLCALLFLPPRCFCSYVLWTQSSGLWCVWPQRGAVQPCFPWLLHRFGADRDRSQQYSEALSHFSCRKSRLAGGTAKPQVKQAQWSISWPAKWPGWSWKHATFVVTPDTAAQPVSALLDFHAHISVFLNMAQIFSFRRLKDGVRVEQWKKIYIKAFPKPVWKFRGPPGKGWRPSHQDGLPGYTGCDFVCSESSLMVHSEMLAWLTNCIHLLTHSCTAFSVLFSGCVDFYLCY